MKTCPECAESIQDAALKCRYCGYRFDSAPAELPRASNPAAAPAPIPSSVRRSSRPFLLIAAGGALLGVGGLMLVVANAGDPGFLGYATDGFFFGGVLLAIGWGALLRRGQAGWTPLLGSLVLVACWTASGFFLSQGDDALSIILAAMLGNLGMALCAFAHLEALELEGLDGARLAAMFAAIGFVIAAVASSRQLPTVIEGIGTWVGVIGTVVFGAALAFSGGQRGLEQQLD